MRFSQIAVAIAGILLPSVQGIPHISDLGAATILTDNDLLGNVTTRTGGAILLPPSSHILAEQRCAALGEKLFSPLAPIPIDFYSGLNASLPYAAHVNENNGSVLYWISTSNKSPTCYAISINGTITNGHACGDKRPALCTQSAPISSSAGTDASPKYQVTVASGSQNITGYRDFHAFRFQGIRFASQPKRFTFSTLYEGSGAVDATKYGPGCIQGPDPRWPLLSEDCLFLNIWTPYLSSSSIESGKRGKLKAVMFWIYGGGFIGGTGTDPEKDCVNVASRGDVVVVSFNYRVGNLGFLPFNDGLHNGNYGISDMLTALQWVRKHIADFGGDPNRITIWGESAGASGVAAMLEVPQAEGLIAGGIIQSMPAEFGSLAGLSRWDEPGDVYRDQTKKVLKESGCEGVADEIECLSRYDAVKWFDSGRTNPGYPTRDGVLLSYRRLPLSGPNAKPHNLPILIGSTRDEYSYLSPPGTNFSDNMVQASAVLNKSIVFLANSSYYAPDLSPSWSSLTTSQKENAVLNATGRVVTDGLFRCPAVAFANSAAKNHVFNPVYLFMFNRTYQPTRWMNRDRVICGRDVNTPDTTEYYKCHGGDVPYTFGNILYQGFRERDGLDSPFARLIVDYWTGFARTGLMAPDTAFLKARSFFESEKKMKEAGAWPGDGQSVMRLQWTGLGVVPVGEEQAGCKLLGLPKDMYETV
ncbi:Alpha/Beta hydrolase protein [Clohesyomyces aquaticus]|uniref:Carboxylic ester hydrolase n=1 Tax=Clohesyomyces aquaticus TaxID=1231657 RepID=A0A1Y1ZM71_9PLEO|nr:Alpha/Beta hydrolase protein [Clohesyomyces aquaticus]